MKTIVPYWKYIAATQRPVSINVEHGAANMLFDEYPSELCAEDTGSGLFAVSIRTQVFFDLLSMDADDLSRTRISLFPATILKTLSLKNHVNLLKSCFSNG